MTQGKRVALLRRSGPSWSRNPNWTRSRCA